VAKRKNSSIMEASQVMLHNKILLKFLWEEATNTTIYVQKRAPHQALDNKIPKEEFTNVKPDIGHLGIFGSSIYFHMPKDKRNKLETTKNNGAFVGYYKIYKEFIIYIYIVKEILILVGM